MGSTIVKPVLRYEIESYSFLIVLNLFYKALWRGHCSRKLHDTHKVISVRRRFREVNRNLKEEDKLCNKTTAALSYLLGYQNYAYILAALKHLGRTVSSTQEVKDVIT